MSAYNAILILKDHRLLGDFAPIKPLTGLRPWTPRGDFRPQTPCLWSPKNSLN